MFQSVLLRRIHRFLAVWLSFAFVLVLVTGTILAWHATGCNISAQGNAPFMDGTSISDLMKALNAEFDFIDAIEFDECGSQKQRRSNNDRRQRQEQTLVCL